MSAPRIVLGAALWCKPESNPSGTLYGNRYMAWRGPWHLRRWYRDARGRATHLRSEAVCGFSPAWGWWGYEVYSPLAPTAAHDRLCARCLRNADTL